MNLREPDFRPAFLAEDVGRIEPDTFRTAWSGVSPAAANTDLKVVSGRCVSLDAGGDPFAATATIENGSEDGLTRVQVSVDGQRRTRWAILRARERRAVVFAGWMKPAPGMHSLQCGDIVRELNMPE